MRSKQTGFALIGLMLTIAIIAVMIAIYYRGSSGKGGGTKTTGQRAIEQTKENNLNQLNQHIEIQNELNSIE